MTIESYVKSIGGSEVLLGKIMEVKNLADQICPDEIVGFHLSEFKKTDGEKVFESMFFFSNKYLLESKNILSETLNIDVTFYGHSIDYLELQLEDYKIGKAIDSSKLKIMGQIENTLFEIQASGSNCDNLWKIINEFIKPNLYTELEFETEESET